MHEAAHELGALALNMRQRQGTTRFVRSAPAAWAASYASVFAGYRIDDEYSDDEGAELSGIFVEGYERSRPYGGHMATRQRLLYAIAYRHGYVDAKRSGATSKKPDPELDGGVRHGVRGRACRAITLPEHPYREAHVTLRCSPPRKWSPHQEAYEEANAYYLGVRALELGYGPEYARYWHHLTYYEKRFEEGWNPGALYSDADGEFAGRDHDNAIEYARAYEQAYAGQGGLSEEEARAAAPLPARRRPAPLQTHSAYPTCALGQGRLVWAPLSCPSCYRCCW